MNCLLRITAVLIVGAVSSDAQTAILFGATGAVGSEILSSLLDGDSSSSFFEEVILIGRRSSPKVDDMISKNKRKEGATNAPKNVTSVILPDLGADLASYENIRSADACFIAIGVGDINQISLAAWHVIEVDLIASITKFCNKLQVSTVTLLSAVDTEYESVLPYSEEEFAKDNGKPLGWMKSIYHYYRMMGLKEKATIDEAAAGNNIGNIRLFHPSSILTKESRYGMVDHILFGIHGMFDPYFPTKYHSVDIKLLGMAMVLDAENVLRSTSDGQEEGTQEQIAKLTYEDFIDIAGKAYDGKMHEQQTKDEL